MPYHVISVWNKASQTYDGDHHTSVFSFRPKYFCFCLLQFVAQPNCQQLLATLWYDGFPGWRRRHWAVKLVTCFIIGLLFPAFSLVYLLAPKSTLGLFIKKPFIKFICHTASYLTFLFLLLLASQHIVQTDLHVQGPPPTIVEWMILPWVLGKTGTVERKLNVSLVKLQFAHNRKMT